MIPKMSTISESASYNSIKVKAHIYVKTSIASCLISTGKNGKPSGSPTGGPVVAAWLRETWKVFKVLVQYAVL